MVVATAAMAVGSYGDEVVMVEEVVVEVVEVVVVVVKERVFENLKLAKSPCCKARSPLGLNHMILLGKDVVAQYKQTI